MGRDKALIEIDGVPMVRRVADALGVAGASTVRTVGGDRAALASMGLDHVEDRWPGEGPLGGVITALGSARRSVVVILSCDLVAPDPAAIRSVVDKRQHQDADLAVPLVGARRQWLHACWHARVEAIIADLFAAGERSIVGAVLGLDVANVEGLTSAAVVDADTPADLPRPDA